MSQAPVSWRRENRLEIISGIIAEDCGRHVRGLREEADACRRWGTDFADRMYDCGFLRQDKGSCNSNRF